MVRIISFKFSNSFLRNLNVWIKIIWQGECMITLNQCIAGYLTRNDIVCACNETVRAITARLQIDVTLVNEELVVANAQRMIVRFIAHNLC